MFIKFTKFLSLGVIIQLEILKGTLKGFKIHLNSHMWLEFIFTLIGTNFKRMHCLVVEMDGSHCTQ